MYENYPSTAGGGQVPEPAQRPAPPTSVQTAVRLRTLEKKYPTYTSTHINALVTSSVVVVIVVGIIAVGLWVWMARMNLKGRNWARITGTVFFGLNTLDLLGVFNGSASSVSAVFAIVTWLVGLGAVIMLWRRESTAYFKPQEPVAY
ncbi:MAG: hypothetical protein ABSF03_19235 [Streptosporangiaceae bacterium]